LANATAGLIWVQSLLGELGVLQYKAPILLCDNISATYCVPNHFFMHEQSTLRWIIILCESVFLVSSFNFVLFLFLIKLPIVLLNLKLRDVYMNFVAISIFARLVIERGGGG
jgi:hypothetical protein